MCVPPRVDVTSLMIEILIQAANDGMLDELMPPPGTNAWALRKLAEQDAS